MSEASMIHRHDMIIVLSLIHICIALLDAVKNESENPYRERDFAILVLFLNCGMRLSEDVYKRQDSRTYPTRSTEEPEGDRVMRGSRDGFVETLISVSYTHLFSERRI